MPPQRILLTQLRRIGDVLMTTAAVRRVRSVFPDAHIAYLTETPSDQIFRNNPRIDEVLTLKANAGICERLRMIATLRSRRFDLVVDFFSNPTSAQYTWVTGAPERIGFGFRGRRWAYTQTVPPPEGLTYAGSDKVALLGPLGISQASGADLLPELFLAAEHHRFADDTLATLGVTPTDLLIAMCPVSRQPYKVWPAKHFAHLADILIERYQAKILMIFGPGEEHFVDAVRLDMIHNALPSIPPPGLLELAALLGRAHVFVGNDGGPRHFAIAMGTPTVGIFGRPFPESWTPPGMAEHRTASYDPGCKSNCTYPHCSHLNCINQVPYEGVQAHTEALLAEVLKDGHPARRGSIA